MQKTQDASKPVDGEDVAVNQKDLLPDELWDKILESVDDNSVMTFASVCKQLRRVQKRSGRELKKRIPMDLRDCNEAARGGHLEVLRYAHEKGCPWHGINRLVMLQLKEVTWKC